VSTRFPSILRLAPIIVLIAITIGCVKKDRSLLTSDGAEATANIAESAMAEAGELATALEGAISPDLMSQTEDIHPLAITCSFATARGNCLNDKNGLSWNGCSMGTAILYGGWTESWSPGFCTDGSQPGALTDGSRLIRTCTQQLLRLSSGATITTSTGEHTAYDGTSIPGTGIFVTMASGVRTIEIDGIRRQMKGPHGRKWFDHSITSSDLTVSGTRAGGDRIATGTMTMYHNLAHYKAVHTFNNVTWGTASCCYPTSGIISSVLTGSRAGTVTLTFNATCGQADFVDTDSTSSTVTLSQCN